MTDPRVPLRAALGEWVRLRAVTRAHATKLAAAEYALTRGARIRDDDGHRLLSSHVAAQRAEFDALVRDLDGRIAGIAGECAALDVDYRALLVDAAALTLSGSDVDVPPDLERPRSA